LYYKLINSYFVPCYTLRAKVKVPAACAIFPNEMTITLALKKLLNREFVNLVRATEMKEGGHFAAFEQPRLLADDIWSTVYEMENIRINSI